MAWGFQAFRPSAGKQERYEMASSFLDLVQIYGI
jgi:hypothetical protein